jgi:membrane-bound lytic murein transglycosylase F
VKNGSISPYDDAIRKYSIEIGWDWRLLAALIYEESRFKHDLVSYGGAFGIMQLMPVTAEKFGVGMDSSPDEHIRAGTKFIQRLDQNFSDVVPDSTERKKFVLAAYNLGEGHVRDAIALSEKYRRNPQLWENNVEYFLIAKSQSRYFRDEVVKNGYCKGIITSGFVKNILNRYEHYKNAFPEL